MIGDISDSGVKKKNKGKKANTKVPSPMEIKS